MLVGGELAHVGAALQDHGLRQRDSHAIHQADVHPADAFQVAADFLTFVKLIFAVRIAFAGGERLEFTETARRQPHDRVFIAVHKPTKKPAPESQHKG